MKKLTLIVGTLLLFATQTNAQMVMEWQSPPGVQSVNSVYVEEISTLPSRSRLDFDGDGIPDIPVFNRLGGHEPFFRVISGKDPNTTWQFPLTGVNFVQGQTKLIGFFDVDDGNGTEKEVIVAAKSNSVPAGLEAAAVINQSGLVLQYSESDLLLGIADYDKDNDLEILIGDTSVRRLELWGKGN